MTASPSRCPVGAIPDEPDPGDGEMTPKHRAVPGRRNNAFPDLHPLRRFCENLPSCRSRVPEPRTLEPADALAWGRIHAHQPEPTDRSLRAKEQPL